MNNLCDCVLRTFQPHINTMALNSSVVQLCVEDRLHCGKLAPKLGPDNLRFVHNFHESRSQQFFVIKEENMIS